MEKISAKNTTKINHTFWFSWIIYAFLKFLSLIFFKLNIFYLSLEIRLYKIVFKIIFNSFAA